MLRYPSAERRLDGFADLVALLGLVGAEPEPRHRDAVAEVERGLHRELHAPHLSEVGPSPVGSARRRESSHTPRPTSITSHRIGIAAPT